LCRNIWGRIQKTGEFNIVQLGWWHEYPVEQAAWPLITTQKSPKNGALEPADYYGHISLNKILDVVKPQAIWVSSDPWMAVPLMARRQRISCPIIAYLAVDGGPLDLYPRTLSAGEDPGRVAPNQLGWHEVVHAANYVVPYGSYGYRVLTHFYPEANVCEPIPLGVDTKVFKYVSQDERDDLKQQLFGVGPDQRVFLSVSRNQMRKNLAYNFLALHFLRSGHYTVCQECGAFNLWHRDYATCTDIRPRSKCYKCGAGSMLPGAPASTLHYYAHVPTDEMLQDSLRLVPLMQQLDLMGAETSDCVFTNTKLRSTHGVPVEEMARYYAACDAFAMPSNEGFGLPFIEAMSTGTPVVALDYSAPPDFLRGAATLVPSEHAWCEPPTGYWRGLPDPHAWTQAIYETCMLTGEAREAARQRARERALEYDWDGIASRWHELVSQALSSSGPSLWTQPIIGV